MVEIDEIRREKESKPPPGFTEEEWDDDAAQVSRYVLKPLSFLEKLATGENDAVAARVIGLLHFTGNRDFAAGAPVTAAVASAAAEDASGPTVNIPESFKWLRSAVFMGDMQAAEILAEVIAEAITEAEDASQQGGEAAPARPVQRGAPRPHVVGDHNDFGLEHYGGEILRSISANNEDPYDQCRFFFETAVKLGSLDSLTSYATYVENMHNRKSKRASAEAAKIVAFLREMAETEASGEDESSTQVGEHPDVQIQLYDSVSDGAKERLRVIQGEAAALLSSFLYKGLGAEKNDAEALTYLKKADKVLKQQ